VFLDSPLSNWTQAKKELISGSYPGGISMGASPLLRLLISVFAPTFSQTGW
jgi:hypothetical protein